MIKILFVGMRHDYDRIGRVTGRVWSHDYMVWYRSLRRFRPDLFRVDAYWFDEVMISRGRNEMNRDLLEHIKRTGPHVAFFAVGGDELKKSTLIEIARGLKITTVFICGDDTWRFDSNSKIFAPYYRWVLTNYSKTIPHYEAMGVKPVLYAGWANTEIFKPTGSAKDIEVGFVGTRTETRAVIVSSLRSAGISVTVRGKGWPEGELPEAKFADFISRSKIILGLIGSTYYFGWRPLARLFLRRPRLGARLPFYLPDIHHFFRNWREWQQKKIPQIKGRLFEVPACRTLQIAEYAEDLEKYYDPDKEIVLFRDADDLISKVRYYLEHAEERERIAAAGYERTLRDHVAERRLTRLLSALGILPAK